MRLALRAMAAALAALFIIPVHLAATVAGRKGLVPPFFLRAIGRIAGLRIRRVGRALPGALYLANHESWLDILALAGDTRAVFVGHSGLAQSPVVRWLASQNDTVFITRHQRGSIARQVDQVRAAIARRPVVIFPEGTTSDGTALLPFRSALLAAVEPLAHEVPIQPVALAYDEPGAVGWYGEESGLSNVRRILSRKGRIGLTIHFLPPITGASLADRKAMTDAARTAIERALAR